MTSTSSTGGSPWSAEDVPAAPARRGRAWRVPPSSASGDAVSACAATAGVGSGTAAGGPLTTADDSAAAAAAGATCSAGAGVAVAADVERAVAPAAPACRPRARRRRRDGGGGRRRRRSRGGRGHLPPGQVQDHGRDHAGADARPVEGRDLGQQTGHEQSQTHQYQKPGRNDHGRDLRASTPAPPPSALGRRARGRDRGPRTDVREPLSAAWDQALACWFCRALVAGSAEPRASRSRRWDSR